MASHLLIDHQVTELRRRLPADVVDELADDLTETYRHHLSRGLDPAAAATAAIAEFGTPCQITNAFTRRAPGRRAAVVLLVTGPVFAACWGSTLGLGRAWAWPIPTAAILGFGLTLLAVVTALVIAATSRHSYRRTRLAAVGGIGLVLLDLTLLATVLFAAPALAWPAALAIPASVIRIGLTLTSVPAILAH